MCSFVAAENLVLQIEVLFPLVTLRFSPSLLHRWEEPEVVLLPSDLCVVLW